MQSSVRHGHTANHLEVIPICAIYWFRLTLKSSSTLIASFCAKNLSPNPNALPLLQKLWFISCELSQYDWIILWPQLEELLTPSWPTFLVFRFWIFFIFSSFIFVPPPLPRFYLKCTLKYFIYCTTFSLCRSFRFLSLPQSSRECVS